MRLPSGRAVRILDTALVVWVAGCIVLALYVARSVDGLTELSRSVVAAGNVLDETGVALEALEEIPFVGDRVGRVSERARLAAASTRASGRSSRESIEDLSLLLGLAVALVPTVPVLALYGPARASWLREKRAVRRALRAGRADTTLDHVLARRALQNVPYPVLRTVTSDPGADLDAGRVRGLADLELKRLGLRR